MNKDSSVYLNHMLDAIALIEKFTLGTSLLEFIENQQVISAVAYQVQVVGEAASKIDPGFRLEHAEIPWQDVIDTRHKIVHHYMNVDPEILWDIVVDALPKLKQQLISLLKE